MWYYQKLFGEQVWFSCTIQKNCWSYWQFFSQWQQVHLHQYVKEGFQCSHWTLTKIYYLCLSAPWYLWARDSSCFNGVWMSTCDWVAGHCQQQLFGDFLCEDSGPEYLDKNQYLHKKKECFSLLILTALAWAFFLFYSKLWWLSTSFLCYLGTWIKMNFPCVPR